MTNIKEKEGVQGIVRLNLLDKDGNVLYHYEKSNRVVNEGRRFLVRALADQNNNAKIDAMSAGTYGGPTRDETVSLDGAYNLIELSGSDISIDLGDNPQITFERVLRKAELSEGAEDLSLKEVGLFYHMNDVPYLFSRFFFPVLTITNDVSLQVIWTVAFLPYKEN